MLNQNSYKYSYDYSSVGDHRTTIFTSFDTILENWEDPSLSHCNFLF